MNSRLLLPTASAGRGDDINCVFPLHLEEMMMIMIMMIIIMVRASKASGRTLQYRPMAGVSFHRGRGWDGGRWVYL